MPKEKGLMSLFGKAGGMVGIGTGFLGDGKKKSTELLMKGTLMGVIGGLIMAIIEGLLAILGKAEMDQAKEEELKQQANKMIADNIEKYAPSSAISNENIKLNDQQLENLRAFTKIYSSYDKDRINGKYTAVLNEALNFLDTQRGQVLVESKAKTQFVRELMFAIMSKDAVYNISEENKKAITEVLRNGDISKLTDEQKAEYETIRKLAVAVSMVDEDSFLKAREIGTSNIDKPFYHFSPSNAKAFGQNQIMKETFAGTIVAHRNWEGTSETIRKGYDEIASLFPDGKIDLSNKQHVDKITDYLVAKSMGIKPDDKTAIDAAKKSYNVNWVADFLTGENMAKLDSEGKPTAWTRLSNVEKIGSAVAYLGSEQGYTRFSMELGYDKTSNYALYMTFKNHIGDEKITDPSQAVAVFHSLLTSQDPEQRALAGRIAVLNFGDNVGDLKLNEKQQLEVINALFKASGLKPDPDYGNDLHQAHIALAGAINSNPWLYDTCLKYRDWYGYSFEKEDFMKHMMEYSYANKFPELKQMGVDVNGDPKTVNVVQITTTLNETKQIIETSKQNVGENIHRFMVSNYLSDEDVKGIDKKSLVERIDSKIEELKSNLEYTAGVLIEGNNHRLFLDEIKQLEQDKDFIKNNFKDGTIYKELSSNAIRAFRFEGEDGITRFNANPDYLKDPEYAKYSQEKLGGEGKSIKDSWEAFINTLDDTKKSSEPYKSITENINNNSIFADIKLTKEISVADLLISKTNVGITYESNAMNLILNGKVDKSYEIKQGIRYIDKERNHDNVMGNAHNSATERVYNNQNSVETTQKQFESKNNMGLKEQLSLLISDKMMKMTSTKNFDPDTFNIVALKTMLDDPNRIRIGNPFAFNSLATERNREIEIYNRGKPADEKFAKLPLLGGAGQKLIEEIRDSDKPWDSMLIKNYICKGLDENSPDVAVIASALKTTLSKETILFVKEFGKFESIDPSELKKQFTKDLIDGVDKNATLDEKSIRHLYLNGMLSDNVINSMKEKELFQVRAADGKRKNLKDFISELKREVGIEDKEIKAIPEHLKIQKELRQHLSGILKLAKLSLDIDRSNGNDGAATLEERALQIVASKGRYLADQAKKYPGWGNHSGRSMEEEYRVAIREGTTRLHTSDTYKYLIERSNDGKHKADPHKSILNALSVLIKPETLQLQPNVVSEEKKVVSVDNNATKQPKEPTLGL